MFRKIMILMIAFVCLLSVSCISAADYNNDNDVVAVADAGTFSDLANDLSSGGNISLTKDYIQTDSYGQITINKDTNINGNGHTIDAKEKSRIFNIINGVNVTLKNINFINGKVNSDYGGAIFIGSGSSVTVEDSSFTNTTSSGNGGAIYTDSSSLTVINSTFKDTTATQNGGAIFGSGSVIVSDSIFMDTIAITGKGGAIYSTTGSVNVTNSTFRNNNAKENGGAICTDIGSVNVVNSNFINTHAGIWGGAISSTGDVFVIDSSLINTTANDGGAISSGANVAVINSSLINTTAFNDGGAISNYGNVNVLNSIFTNSQAFIGGGVIYTKGNVNVFDSNFRNNTAKEKGGVIYSNSSSSILVTNSTFTDTIANEGGAINGYNIAVMNSNFTNNIANNTGGAIFGKNVTVIDSNFKDTAAINTDGGAIAGKDVMVMDSNFINTKATGQYSKGGAIYAYEGSANVINSTFTNITTHRGGAIYVNPHKVHNSSFAVIGSTFTNIHSSQNGGAIWGGSGEAENFTFIVADSTFNNTIAGQNGGAIYSAVTSGSFDVINSTFNDNSASKGASIYAGGVMNLEDSTFNSPNATGNAVIYLYTNNDVNLNNNTIESNLLAIYNTAGIIKSPTTLTFNTVTVEKGENATLTAVFTDDNGNIIGSNTNVKGKVNGTSVFFRFNETTRNFTAIYTNTANEGKYPVTGTFSIASDCDVTDGALYVGQVFEIDAPSIVKYYKNGTQFIVKLTENGRAIIGSQVEITINGATYKRTTDMNGTCKLNINLASGEYDVNVTAIGSFGELTTNATVTVLPTIEGNDTVLYYRNGTKYNAIFLDEQGNPLNNTKVTFNINGVTYERTTNENGTTSGLNINLAPGEYIITATNPVNGEMHSNIITVLPTIKSENLVKYYKNGSQFVAKALDKQGQASAGQKVTFNINGVIYNRTTDDNGEAKLNINLAAGNSAPEIYIITTECNGCTVSNNVIVLPVILGEDMNIGYMSGEKYNVFVFDGQGELEEGVPITFNINGVNYHRTSNSDGTTSGLTINLQPGEYIITAIRDDNGATISNNIVVSA